MVQRAAVLMLFLVGVSQGALRVREILRVPVEPFQTLSSVTADGSGNLLVTGNNDQGGFVQKLDASGNVVFSKFVFGFSPSGAVADANGDVYWIGAGIDLLKVFPFTGSILGSPDAQFTSGFVAKFNGRDGSIIWAMKLGALQPDAIAVDASGQVTIAGFGTVSGGFTTVGAYSSTTIGMNFPIEVVRLAADGRLVFATAYGGQTVPGGTLTSCAVFAFGVYLPCPRIGLAALLLDPQGNIWISGSTNMSDLPITANALNPHCSCDTSSSDGFLAEINADGSTLLYATFLNAPGEFVDDSNYLLGSVSSAAMDGKGHIWLAGNTNSADLRVTPGAVQPQLQGNVDAYIFEYDPASNQIPFSTYYGTALTNYVTNIAIDPSGNVLLSGQVSGSLGVPESGQDFVALLGPSGADVLTFPPEATGSGLARMPSGSFVVGGTLSQVTLIENSMDTSPSISAVSNSARLAAAGQVSPGEIISIYGTNIGPAGEMIATLGAGQTGVPTELSGVQVLFDGVAAPLISVASNRIEAVVPFGTATKATTILAVNNGGTSSNTAKLAVVTATPGIYITQDQYHGFPIAAALNEDGTLNSATNRAAPGSVISIFATGLGQLAPQPPDGAILSGSNGAALQRTLWVASGVLTLDILYAGPAPGQVAGAMQLNVRIPNEATDPLPIVVFADTWTSQYFTVWVSGS